MLLTYLPIAIAAVIAIWAGVEIYQARKAKADTTPDAVQKPRMESAVDDVALKIKGILDGFGIPQSLQNIKRFAEVGIALAGIDGLRKLVGDIVPAEKQTVVGGALDTLRAEVASSLIESDKPAA